MRQEFIIKDQHTYALQATSDFLQTLVLSKKQDKFSTYFTPAISFKHLEI